MIVRDWQGQQRYLKAAFGKRVVEGLLSNRRRDRESAMAEIASYKEKLFKKLSWVCCNHATQRAEHGKTWEILCQVVKQVRYPFGFLSCCRACLAGLIVSSHNGVSFSRPSPPLPSPLSFLLVLFLDSFKLPGAVTSGSPLTRCWIFYA